MIFKFTATIGMLTFLINIYLIQKGVALKCMTCTSFKDISECDRQGQQCGPGEQCYTEQVTNDMNQVVYNSGCRSDAVCRIMQAFGKRHVQRDIVSCSKCCNTPNDDFGACNSKLCKLGPPKPKPKCLFCSGVSSAKACLTNKECQSSEVCANRVYSSSGRILFDFYCKDRSECKTQSSRSSGSEVEYCQACCLGDNCNENDCFQLKKNFTAADFTR